MYSTKGSITSTVYTSRREAPVGRRSTQSKAAFSAVQTKPVTAFDSVARPENLPDEIAEQLRSRILNESLAAGQRLPTEQELGAQFSVSRNVIREAIARLKLMGLVETRHGVGTFVCADLALRPFDVSHDDLLDMSQLIHVYQLRVEIESGAAALAATNRTSKQLEKLQQALKRADETSDDWEVAAQAALDFHLAVAQASNNPYVVRIMGHLSAVIHNAVRTTRFGNVGTNRVHEIEDEHHQIVDAIVRRDAVAARQIMRTHLENGISRYRTLFGAL